MSEPTLEELKVTRHPGMLLRIPPEQDVPVTQRVMRIIDSAPMRRLNDISQLGLVRLVYPGARHSRFEHSLGVYRLALAALEHLFADPRFAEQVNDAEAEAFVLAALLHDIGHWPMCHPIEDMRLPWFPRHEARAREILCDEELSRCIREDWSTDPETVADLIQPIDSRPLSAGLQLLRSVLSGPIDIDKLDYLNRDSLHAGVPYGRNFDLHRLLGSLCVGEDGRSIAITSKGKTAAEMLVFARYIMFSEVYWHHAVRSATAMLQRLVYELGEEVGIEHLQQWSDAQVERQLFEAARDRCELSSMAEGLFGARRSLYKRLLSFSYVENHQAHHALARRSYADSVRCATALCEQLNERCGAGLQAADILIDAPPVKLEVQFHLSVRLAPGRYAPLAELSPLVRSLALDQFDNYVKRVHVFIHPDKRPLVTLSQEELSGALLTAAESIFDGGHET